MEYVIQHKGNKNFLHVDKKKGIFWTDDVLKATHYASMKSAFNYINGTLKAHIEPRQLAVKEYEAVSAVTKAIAENNPEISNPEIAKERFKYIDNAINELITMFPFAKEVRAYFAEEVKNYDRATQDILHKIELSPSSEILGLSSYYELQELRRQRREAKDKCLFLQKLLEITPDYLKKIEDFKQEMDDRHYNARILKDMYNREVSDETVD